MYTREIFISYVKHYNDRCILKEISFYILLNFISQMNKTGIINRVEAAQSRWCTLCASLLPETTFIALFSFIRILRAALCSISVPSLPFSDVCLILFSPTSRPRLLTFLNRSVYQPTWLSLAVPFIDLMRNYSQQKKEWIKYPLFF